MATCRYGISPQVFNKGKGMIIRILNWCPTLKLGDFWGVKFRGL